MTQEMLARLAGERLHAVADKSGRAVVMQAAGLAEFVAVDRAGKIGHQRGQAALAFQQRKLGLLALVHVADLRQQEGLVGTQLQPHAADMAPALAAVAAQVALFHLHQRAAIGRQRGQRREAGVAVVGMHEVGQAQHDHLLGRIEAEEARPAGFTISSRPAPSSSASAAGTASNIRRKRASLSAR